MNFCHQYYIRNNDNDGDHDINLHGPVVEDIKFQLSMGLLQIRDQFIELHTRDIDSKSFF